MIISILMSILI